MIGDTTITCYTQDAVGNIGASVSYIVSVQDTIAPDIESITANPGILWPPNHQMTTVNVEVAVNDVVDPVPHCVMSDSSSNEPQNGTGDGDEPDDFVIIGDLIIELRAERSGTGNGRIYSATVTCSDESGNTSTGQVQIIVPHDQGGPALPEAGNGVGQGKGQGKGN